VAVAQSCSDNVAAISYVVTVLYMTSGFDTVGQWASRIRHDVMFRSSWPGGRIS